MQWNSEKIFHPSLSTLRQFAGLSLIALGGAAYVQGFVRHHVELAEVLAVIGFGIGAVGLIKPAFIRPIFVAATVLTFPIGWAVSRLILACLYFGLVTPVAVVFRLIGRDTLRRRHSASTNTYWSAKILSSDPKSYFRMF
jgi:hypothetical protein